MKFLIETKMFAFQMDRLKRRLGMDEVLCVARNEENGGYSGGLCMLLKKNITVS